MALLSIIPIFNLEGKDNEDKGRSVPLICVDLSGKSFFSLTDSTASAS